MADIRIVPGSSIMSFTSSLNYVETLKQDVSGSLNLYGSGSTGRAELFSIDGNNGRLFTVSDDLSDSLFSVNTIAGLPVIEAFANNTVVMGQYGTNALVVSGSNVGIGTTSPSEKLEVSGSVKATGFKTPSGTSTQFLMADGSVNSNTYAKTDGTGATGNWGINITGNANKSYRVIFNDGPRDLSDRLPNSFSRTVNFDFVTSGTVGGVGNYAGVMTFSPWDGTSTSTGDSSYQLAFYNQTGINGSGIPGLKIRKGIDTTWNSWYKVYTDGDFSSTNISNWNTAYGWGNHASAGYLKSSDLSNYVTTNTPQTITGHKEFQASGNTYYQTSLQVKGNGSTIYPGIGFHQPGVVANQLNMTNDGWFQFTNGDNSDYANLRVKNITSNGMLTFGNNVGGVYGVMGDNDAYRIWGRAAGSNQGYLEISTADDGNKPIIVSQYTGQFINKIRQAVLLDESGNTSFPGAVSAGSIYTSYILGSNALAILTPGGGARVVKSGGLLASNSYADEPPSLGIMSRGKNYFHNQYDGQPTISIAIGDNDTGFNWEGDGVISYYSNGVKLFNLNNVWHSGNFNPSSYQPAGNYVTIGTAGIVNYIPKFTASGTIGNSLIYDNGSSVGIGTTALGARLDVRAQGALATDIVFRVRNSNDTQNFLVVNGAGDVYNRGAQGVDTNTFFGEDVGRTSTGGYNSAFGVYSLRLNTVGAYNIAIGHNSLVLNTSGSFNTAVGTEAMYSNTSGNNNIAIGHSSLTSNTSGTYNTAIGYNALLSNTTGVNNSALGYGAGAHTKDSNSNQTSNNSVYVGYNTKASASGNTNEIVIGADAIGNGSNTVTLGNDSITKTVLKGDVVDLTGESIYLKLITVNGNTTITNSFHNKIVRITASCTITIPAGLRTDFNCTFEVIGAYTAQFVDGSGATTSAPFGRYLKTDLTAMFYCTGTASNYRLNGSLATS